MEEAKAHKCPKCGSLVGHSIGDIGIQFKCGTIRLATGGYSEALPCVMRQRDQLATEVDTLRTANAALVERVKRLEASGDEMAEWLRNPRNLGDDPFMADQWDATKRQP